MTFTMIIGILELPEYQFIQDVARKLSDIGTEFVSFGERRFPGEERFRVIIDRLSFQDPYLRQMMQLAAMNGTYVLNNPFATTINNKILDSQMKHSLGIKQPMTIVLPRMNEEWNLGSSLHEPAWDMIRREMNFPCILKPFDGFAWDDVYVVASFRELENLYNALKFRKIMLLQEKIEYTSYFRVFCVSKKDTLIARWVPKPFGLGEYRQPDKIDLEAFGERMSEATIRLNRKMDFDFNAVEWCVDEEGELFVIDSMNEVPDIDRRFIPDDHYNWLVDRFSACVREAFVSDRKNRSIFD